MQTPKRKPRSDALRNRERLIEAAKEILSPGGPGASLEAVAKRAGVGIGTLYRHFPDREALFYAVFIRELDELAELAEALDTSEDALEALRGWLHANVAMVETKRGMLGALAVVMSDDCKAAYTDRASRVEVALNRLIARGVAEGRMREGVTAEDLLQTTFALCYARDPGPGWRDNVLRLLDIFIDGLAK